ncbi:MAG: TrkA C-terminal domain-containing protein, partial [Mycobacterium sp.]
ALNVGFGSELDGLRMIDVSTQIRVIAITRQDAPTQVNPRRDTRFRAGDTAYLVGPYRELLDTLRQGQSAAASRRT